MSLLWTVAARAEVNPDLENLDACGCGCGCEPDGDWHWSQQPWCPCISQGCPCVTDKPRKTSARHRPTVESTQHILDNYCFDDAWPEHQHTPGREAWKSVKANYDLDHPIWDAMRDDVRRNGIQKPIHIDYDESPPRVRDGHTRLLMAEQLGLPQVPVKHMTGWESAMEREHGVEDDD